MLDTWDLGFRAVKTYITVGSEIGIGKMELVSNKNKLHITFNATNGNYNPCMNTEADWSIRELT